MNYIFIFILYVLSIVFLFPVQSVHSQGLFPITDEAIPSQLKPPTEDVAQLDEVIDDSAYVKPYDIPMILNDSVEKNLEYFKTRGRVVFQIWLDRAARYIPVMKEIFKEKNLP